METIDIGLSREGGGNDKVEVPRKSMAINTAFRVTMFMEKLSDIVRRSRNARRR